MPAATCFGTKRLKHMLDLQNFVVDKLPEDSILVVKYLGVGF
jgi:hypothetical protein